MMRDEGVDNKMSEKHKGWLLAYRVYLFLFLGWVCLLRTLQKVWSIIWELWKGGDVTVSVLLSWSEFGGCIFVAFYGLYSLGVSAMLVLSWIDDWQTNKTQRLRDEARQEGRQEGRQEERQFLRQGLEAEFAGDRGGMEKVKKVFNGH